MVQSDTSSEGQSLSQGSSFSISPRASEKMCLSTQGGQGGNGTRVVISSCNGSISQNWSEVGPNSSLVAFVNKCLDVVDGNKQNGAKLQIWDCFENNTNQRWTRQGNTLKWMGTNKCLDLTDGKTTDGSDVQLWDCAAENDNQKWAFNSIVGGTVDGGKADFDSPVAIAADTAGYIASNLDPMSCIEHPKALEARDNYILQNYPCNYTATQSFTYTGEGSLKDIESGRCLTASSDVVSSKNNEIVVSMAPCEINNLKQQWDYFGGPWRDRNSHMCLDLFQGDTRRDSRLRVSPCIGSSSQSWAPIRPLSIPVPDPTDQGQTLAERCSPRIYISYHMKDTETQRFMRANPNAVSIIKNAALKVCEIIFSKPEDIPLGKGYVHAIVTWDLPYVAGFLDHELTINGSNFSTGVDEFDPSDFIAIMHHEMTHFYQSSNVNAPGWIIEGMADYVRLRAGLFYNLTRKKGGSYTEGYGPAGFFLLYIDDKYPGFIKQVELNLHAPATTWDPNFFQKKTGKNVDQLWAEYQASF